MGKTAYYSVRIGLLAACALLLAGSVGTAAVFSTIDFETGEGFAAPSAYDPSTPLDNIANGGSSANAMNDVSYGGTTPISGVPASSWMFAWNGQIADGSADYGVPSGNAAFLYNANWHWSYARNNYNVPRPISTLAGQGRYMTVEYNSFVMDSRPPYIVAPAVAFWYNAGGGTYVVGSRSWGAYITIYHSQVGDPDTTNNIYLQVDGITYPAGTWQPQTWIDEKLVLDKLLNQVTYYYNGIPQGVFPLPHVAQWSNYGMDTFMVSRNGALGIDDVRFGAQADPDPTFFYNIDFEQTEQNGSSIVHYNAPGPFAPVPNKTQDSIHFQASTDPSLPHIAYSALDASGNTTDANGNTISTTGWLKTDFSDVNYATGEYNYVWNGIDGTGWHICPSGTSSFLMDPANTANVYTRTGFIPVPTARQTDKNLIVDYWAYVNTAGIVQNPGPGNYNALPPTFRVGIRGLNQQNHTGESYPRDLIVYHTEGTDAVGSLKLHLSANGYNDVTVGDYVKSQWVRERMVFDRTTGSADYYYNYNPANPVKTYTFQDSSWVTDNYTSCQVSVWCTNGGRQGTMSIDALNLGTGPTTPPSLRTINYADNVTIDGNLNDWNDATWIPLDKEYNGGALVADGGDISSAAYAVKWGAGGTKMYVAVKVQDATHKFTDTYTDWWARDAVEMYLHTTGAAPADWLQYQQVQDSGQEWIMGIKDSNHNAVWGTCGYPPRDGDFTPTPDQFNAVGKVNGDWLYYEAAISPYIYFAGRWNGYHPDMIRSSVVSLLSAGQTINFDLDAVTNDGTSNNYWPAGPGYLGMAADTVASGWSNNWSIVPQAVLVRTGVVGTIALSGYSGSLLGVTATVVVTDGTTSETHTVILDGLGTYSFNTALSGACTATAASVSVLGYQSQTLPVTITSGQGSVNFTLSLLPITTVTSAKKQALGTVVRVSGSMTAAFTNDFYIESTDRTSGIWVKKTAHGFTASNVSTIFNVGGTLRQDPSTNELYLDAFAADVTTSTATIKPVGLLNKAVAGGNFNSQPGVVGARGLNNIGLLVRTNGFASGGDSTGFAIDDGSGVTTWVSVPGGGTSFNNHYVEVNAISSIAAGGTRLLKARAASDVSVIF